MPQIFDHVVVLKPELLLDQLEASPEIYQKLDENYDQFRSHTLIAAHQFTEDWSTWEMHPHGDELVVLLSGQAVLLLRQEAGDESVVLNKPGAFAIVPKGTWHTARISEATSMLFVTPGEGTENETSPPSGG
tara:strand:+ start:1486 stop:1881 length:396 start_codon:yes stop_codon:yes gene_type:complete